MTADTAPIQTDATGTAPSESNRDRVRRLLFDPLGFRHPKTMPEDRGRMVLNAIADDLAYLSDDGLAALERMLRVHGQGSARNFWPDRATFINFAHVVQPLPLDQDPKLVSWFASVEGQRMVEDGTLVETWRYFEARRIPPATPEARRLVATRADEARRRLGVIADKERLGYHVAPDDADWARWYRDLTARLEALVATARSARQAVA